MMKILFLMLIDCSLPIWAQITGIILDQCGGTQIINPFSTPAAYDGSHLGLPQLGNGAAVMFNHSAYFIGGVKYVNCTQQMNGKLQKTVVILNTVTNSTRAGPSLVNARGYHSATVYNNSNNLLVCGGERQDTSSDNSCEMLSMDNDKFVLSSPMPVALANFVMVTLNDLPYIFGGYLGGGIFVPSDAAYYFDGESWTTVAPLPVKVQNHAGVTINESAALICGGNIGDWLNVSRDCYIYDADIDSYKHLPDCLVEPIENFLLFNFAGGIYAPGGMGTDYSYDIIQLFNGHNWAKLPYRLLTAITQYTGVSVNVKNDA